MSGRQFIRRGLGKAAYLLECAGRSCYAPQRERVVAAWRAADGDRTLRLTYELQPDSLVVDVGGFRGQWASDIFAQYLCRVHIFEPLPDLAAEIGRRFAQNPRIVVHAEGLAGETRAAKMRTAGDGSAVVTSGKGDVEVRLVAAAEAFAREAWQRVDVMKINVEGGEYELLEHLMQAGLMRRIADLQVQFHDSAPRAIERRRGLQEQLRRTHHLTYEYPFVWENWRLGTCAGGKP